MFMMTCRLTFGFLGGNWKGRVYSMGVVVGKLFCVHALYYTSSLVYYIAFSDFKILEIWHIEHFKSVR